MTGLICTQTDVGQDSRVGIVTRYGLDGPWLEPWWGQDFLHASRLAPRQAQPPVNGHRISFLEVKWSGQRTGHPPPSSAQFVQRCRHTSPQCLLGMLRKSPCKMIPALFFSKNNSHFKLQAFIHNENKHWKIWHSLSNVAEVSGLPVCDAVHIGK
jgi:hypothetical protein